jgi:nitrilase
LIPTGGERLIWGHGDGRDIKAIAASFGTIGSLICWENYMPLARQALYDQGMEILAAPTWDKSDHWIQSMQHIAREGGTYVISCCMGLRLDDIPDETGFREFYPGDRDWINTGRSCIISPRGKILAGPVEEREEIIFAEFDRAEIAASKRLFDVAGHYSRPDVFHFTVNTASEKAYRRDPENKQP